MIKVLLPVFLAMYLYGMSTGHAGAASIAYISACIVIYGHRVYARQDALRPRKVAKTEAMLDKHACECLYCEPVPDTTHG